MQAEVRRLVCDTRKGPGRPYQYPFELVLMFSSYPSRLICSSLCELLNGTRYLQLLITIAQLLVARHSIPEQLLSDRGPNFLSCEVKLLVIQKVNTGYHSQ